MSITADLPVRTRKGKFIEISGVVDTVTFGNEETGYGILKLRVDEQFKTLSCVSKKGIITLTGNLARVTPGERVKATGTLSQHQTFGPQIDVESFILTEPKGYSDLVKYLAKNVKYVDKVLARAIVDKFGTDTISVIDNTPERLLEVSNIGKKRLEELKVAWSQQKEFRQLLMFASSLGIGGAAIQSIFDEHGHNSINVIREDPYSLARDVWGIGFKKADEIARHLGIQELEPKRLLAAVEHTIREKSQSEGDCFQYVMELVNACVAFFGDPKINAEMIRMAVIDGIKQGKLVHEGDRIYLPKLLKAECDVAQRLKMINNASLPVGLRTLELREKAVKAALSTFAFTPAERQVEGVQRCMSCKTSVVTGPPGSGKTAISRAIVHGFEEAGLPVTLIAPTGRAAKRMREVIGRPASTIQRLLFSLDMQVKSGADKNSLLINGAVLIDEVSMCDVSLMSWLLSFIHPSAMVVMVGDKDQLPSVGPGAVLRDLIDSNVIAVTSLTQIFRQSEGSNISITAAKINEGVMPETLVYFGSNHPFVVSDMYTITQENAEEQANIVTWCATEMARKFGFDPMKDCQVVAPMYKGAAGVGAINSALQKILNPNPIASFKRNDDVTWGVGDKVMQLKNNYQLGALNGDIGNITAMDFDGSRLTEIEVDFEGSLVRYNSGAWNQLTLSYATTIHKMQGSEMPMIVMVLHTSHYMMLQRNLLYTGLTRGKKLVVLVCSEAALGHAIRNNKITRRNTMLADRLRQPLQPVGMEQAA